MTATKVLHLAVLVVFGIAGNYFGVPLYLGVDFLFGSVAALVALSAFGILAGTTVAAVAGIYTYFLWGHPFAAIIFTLEVLVVGLLRRRRQNSLILLDGLFWLTLGFPLVLLVYRGALHLDPEMALLIAVKQSVNGIFNALLASALVTSVPPYRWKRATESVRSSLAAVMIALVLLPGLVVMVLDGRRLMHQLESYVEVRVQDTCIDIGSQVHDWLSSQRDAVRALADVAAESPALRHDVALVKHTVPGITCMYVADASGTTIASWPEVNGQGEPTVGLNSADRDYFQRARKTLQPVVSGIFQERGDLSVPIVTVNSPILEDGRFHGLVTGVLDLSYLSKILADHDEVYGSLAVDADVTLVDAYGVVIASTARGYAPMAAIRRTDPGHSVAIGDRFSRWVPDEPGLPKVARWQRSFYVYEAPVGADTGWRLIVEAPVAPLQKALYSGYLRSLAVLAGLLVVALPLASVFSRWLVRPLNQLADLTADLPDRLLADQPCLGLPVRPRS